MVTLRNSEYHRAWLKPPHCIDRGKKQISQFSGSCTRQKSESVKAESLCREARRPQGAEEINCKWQIFFFFFFLKPWADNGSTTNQYSCHLFYGQGWHTSCHFYIKNAYCGTGTWWNSPALRCLSYLIQIRSDQLLSGVRLFATPWITARQASLSITNSRSSLRLTFIESVMPSSHLILCHPLLLLPPIPPSLFQWVNSSHEVAKVLEFQL